MTITHYSELSGAGLINRGVDAVPGVKTVAAANHDSHACATHRLNFPDAEVFEEDLTKMPIEKMPWADMASFAPACPGWTTANGMVREFDRANVEQGALFSVEDLDQDPTLAKRKEDHRRSRLLMKEVLRYLQAKAEAGTPVPIGFLENVIQCRLWSEWDWFVGELRKIGYKLRLIALNSMHARPVRTRKPPQSRDRLYLAFWLASIGRDPDWDKWLRPKALCPRCLEIVDAVQVFKKPGVDMGRHGSQYIYACPKRSCGGQEVRPDVLPALSVIDPTVSGVRIGDRESLGMPKLADATMGRLAAGIRKEWLPLLLPVGGTWRGDGEKGAQSLHLPMPTRTTRETDGVAVPPLLIPVEGRPGKVAASAARPMRTMTTRNETAVVLPFITPLRGGGDRGRARPITEPLSTVTASGNHHGLATPPAGMDQGELTAWAQQLLVPYYGATTSARPASEPIGTLTTHDKYGVACADDFAEWEQEVSPERFAKLLQDVLFRMLMYWEVQAAMGVDDEFTLAATSNRIRIKLLGNGVTPASSEVITSALVECYTGCDLERELAAA